MMIVDCIVYALQYLHGTGSVVDFCRRLTADGQAVEDALAQHGLGSIWAPAAKMQLSVAGHEPKARCRPWTDASAKIKRLMGGIWMMMRKMETGG